MFDIEIVKAGNKGLRPGVVAIEYIDWVLALLYVYVVLPISNPYLSRVDLRYLILWGLTTIKKSAALPATAHFAGTPNLTL